MKEVAILGIALSVLRTRYFPNAMCPKSCLLYLIYHKSLAIKI